MRLLRKDGVESMTDTLTDQASEAKRTALGTLLIERGYIDQGQLDEALRRSAENGERLGEVIVKLGWASEDDLAKVLAEQWHLRYFERSAISFDGKALRRMSWEDASRLEALPIQENDEGGVVVAVAEPTDARLLALRELLGDRIDFVVVARTAIETGLRSELLARNGSSTTVEAAPVEENEPEVTDESEHVDAVESEDDGSGQFKAYEAMATVSAFEPQVVGRPAVEPTPIFGGSVAEAAEAGADNFDEVARTLSDGLTSQLASLRAIVVEAETRRESDRIEIERLHADVANRDETIQSRDETIRSLSETISSTQRQLREFADSLEQNPSF
jgi:Type II secretion system (T2SS), protein E, N-terminal domain